MGLEAGEGGAGRHLWDRVRKGSEGELKVWNDIPVSGFRTSWIEVQFGKKRNPGKGGGLGKR